MTLEKLCKVSPPIETELGISVQWLGRWVLNYERTGKGIATYVPHAFTGGVSKACVDSQHPGNIAMSDLSQLHIDAAKLFDFDADGYSEILLSGPIGTLRDHPETEGIALEQTRLAEIVTYRNDQIGPYQPAIDVTGDASLVDMRDLDHDGRPDLLFTFSGFERDLLPQRVGHSLPNGTFSATDPVANAAVRNQCSATSSSSLPALKADGTADLSASATAVACAMLRGEKPADVQRRLAQGCSKLKSCASLVTWAANITTRGLR